LIISVECSVGLGLCFCLSLSPVSFTSNVCFEHFLPADPRGLRPVRRGAQGGQGRAIATGCPGGCVATGCQGGKGRERVPDAQGVVVAACWQGVCVAGFGRLSPHAVGLEKALSPPGGSSQVDGTSQTGKARRSTYKGLAAQPSRHPGGVLRRGRLIPPVYGWGFGRGAS
jgi:hypothetical protein